MSDQEEMSQSEREMELIGVAAALLKAVWSQIDADFKSKYRMDIWTQFQSNIAACSQMTNSLHNFLSKVCGKFSVATPGADEAERTYVDDVLRGRYGNPDDILQIIRAYSQVVVMEVRIMNDARKEVYHAGH